MSKIESTSNKDSSAFTDRESGRSALLFVNRNIKGNCPAMGAVGSQIFVSTAPRLTEESPAEQRGSLLVPKEL